MPTITSLLRAHAYATAAGRPTAPSLDELWQSEWSACFERAMRHRLVMGALRHGVIGAAGKPDYDRVTEAIRRLCEYRRTGNLEFLVDAANFCLLEFVESRHPQRHWAPSDDAEHCV